VVKAGVFPLVRCALLLEELNPIVRLFGMGTAALGVSYAVFEKDTKRLLAFSTVSQLGWILSAPQVAGFYALTHGLAKATLFLTAGALPSRNFKELEEQPMNTALWIPLVMGGLSISGFPLLAGFEAKVLTLKNLLHWQALPMNFLAVGTAITLSKLIFLPHESGEQSKPIPLGFWLGVIPLLGALIVANCIYYPAYNLANILKAIAVIGIGWAAYAFIFHHFSVKLPRIFEEFDHLIGVMTLILLLLFWVAFQ
jgi:multicomponent Na+:H+ antiporter subunit D